MGTVAALACLGLSNLVSKSEGVNLVSTVDPEIAEAYTNYMSRYSKSFLTKAEYNARLSNFRSTFNEIK